MREFIVLLSVLTSTVLAALLWQGQFQPALYALYSMEVNNVTVSVHIESTTIDYAVFLLAGFAYALARTQKQMFGFRLVQNFGTSNVLKFHL